MKKETDFFLSAARENAQLANPRGCSVIAQLKNQLRDDHLLIEIRPALIGQNYGLGGKNITNLILSARYEGDSFFPVKEWPCHVYISRILDNAVIKTLAFTRDQIEIIAWGMIFRTLDEAKAFSEEL